MSKQAPRCRTQEETENFRANLVPDLTAKHPRRPKKQKVGKRVKTTAPRATRAARMRAAALKAKGAAAKMTAAVTATIGEEAATEILILAQPAAAAQARAVRASRWTRVRAASPATAPPMRTALTMKTACRVLATRRSREGEVINPRSLLPRRRTKTHRKRAKGVARRQPKTIVLVRAAAVRAAKMEAGPGILTRNLVRSNRLRKPTQRVRARARKKLETQALKRLEEVGA